MTDINATGKPKRGGFTAEMRAKAAATRAAKREARDDPHPDFPSHSIAQVAPGLTTTTCPTACHAGACVFVDKPYCAHPYKGGPQGTDISKPSVIARINEAKRIIGKRKLDVRYA